MGSRLHPFQKTSCSANRRICLPAQDEQLRILDTKASQDFSIKVEPTRNAHIPQGMYMSPPHTSELYVLCLFEVGKRLDAPRRACPNHDFLHSHATYPAKLVDLITGSG